MKDSQVKLIFRYVFLVFVILSALYIILYPSWKSCVRIFAIYLIFIIIMAAYRYHIYKKIYANFLKISNQKNVVLKKGNFFFGFPHTVEFTDSGKIYSIGCSVNPMLDYMIEYISPIDREIELRLMRQKKKIISTGQDKYLNDIIQKEPVMSSIIKELISDFSNLHIGKDGFLRLIARYDSYLTKPEKAFSIFEKVKMLVIFIESKTK